MRTMNLGNISPKCKFRGQKIPCHVTCSPKGSITSTILADMLKWIDGHAVLPRVPGGPTPFLLLDGHGSRLEVPFLKYINDTPHKWVVCIGVPNGTSIWQVGDSNEQNGTYKMYCSEYKKRLTSKRFEMGMFKMNLVRTDIIPIVNYAWKRSFNNVSNNLKAIADRGWGPLNRVLLSHPEIISSKPNSMDKMIPSISNDITTVDNISTEVKNVSRHDVDEKFVPIEDLNFNSGFAGDVIATILRKAQRDAQILKNISLSNEHGSNFISSMENAKKFSAGVIFKHGKCYLDEDVLSMAMNAKEKKETQFKERISKLYKN